MSRSIVLAVTAAIAISGCNAGGQQETPGPGATESPALEATRSPGDGGSRAPSEPSVFAMNEEPPTGVSDFLEAIPGGGILGPCEVNPPAVEPGVAIHETVIPTSLCGLGFIPGREVALLLRGPGGREWPAQITADEYGAFEWEVEELPRNLEGEYFAQATQAETAPVERTFNVQFDELVAAVVPRYFLPGGSTELVVAGGEPGQRVPAHLYRQRTDGRWRFVADLGPLVLDGNGYARLELRSRRGDQRATYMVVVDPQDENIEDIGYWFVLGRNNEVQ